MTDHTITMVADIIMEVFTVTDITSIVGKDLKTDIIMIMATDIIRVIVITQA
jgi:hypothetical protein